VTRGQKKWPPGNGYDRCSIKFAKICLRDITMFQLPIVVKLTRILCRFFYLLLLIFIKKTENDFVLNAFS